MNTAIPSVLLLLCITVCTLKGETVMYGRCRCIQLSRHLTRATVSRITNIRLLTVNPFCSKIQVIVTLRDGSERCLDPYSSFTQKLLETEIRTKQRRSSSLRMTTTSVVSST